MDLEFGEKIIKLRNMKGMTQEELAIRINVSRQAISKWERGEGYPDLYNIQSLASALDTSVENLVKSIPHETYHDQPEIEQKSTPNPAPKRGSSINSLIYKAKNTTNSKEARKIKKTLITGGILAILLGAGMILGGFIGFASGGMNNPWNFNPIPFMILFISGAPVAGIGVYALIAGLGIEVFKFTANFLDTRKKCPKCNDEIDNDELVCSNCGYRFNDSVTCSCGKVNEITEHYCRSCGKKLK